MAEERLIDTDKDKKYRIRKNADGEDELYIDESSEEQEVEEVAFLVDDEGEKASDEDYAEQYAQSGEERAKREEEIEFLICSARRECQEGRFATAADYLEKATDLDSQNGEIYALQLIIYTRNFTDYSQINEAIKYTEGLEKYTSAKVKAELFARAESGLKENISGLQSTVNTLSEENEKQKATRAKRFVADRNKSAITFSILFAVFAVLAGVAVYCYLNIHSVKTHEYLIAAIILTAVAAVALIASGVVLRRLVTASRRVRLNNKDSSTELGRNLLARRAELNAFTAIYEALKG